MTGAELKDQCAAAVAEAAADEPLNEILLRRLLAADPEDGHHDFARTVDRLRELAPGRSLDDAIRAVAGGEVPLPTAWIEGVATDAEAPQVEVFLEGLSINVNGQEVDLSSAEALQELQALGKQAHVVTEFEVHDEDGQVQRKVVVDGEEIDPAELATRLADLPPEVRRVLERDEEEA